ncbi:oxidoreductase [Subtercola boreus]|uniref:Oxidoreductase n=2 Tax=Subtercola boreus TaxID=120213 RepID=A0A3E0WE61_9MICO|nr:oxidoreductase [Subtercola boreus]RFA23306.1 oxidoreductase [Subtercola boreus]RFA29109.1 oxidoreductase [Subtercola boreus]
MGRVWLQLLLESPDVDLVGLVDLDTEAARRVLTELGRSDVLVGSSISEVAEAASAHAVVNVTVPVAHHPVNIEAMFAGLPVLCEKPIAPTVSQAFSLAAASEATGQLLMTSQSRRYYPVLTDFKTSLQSLGEVGIATTEFFMAPHFGGFRDSMDQPLLIDMSIHAFDVARYLLDADPVSVYCDSYNPSWSWYAGDAATTALFEFDGGIRYTFVGSWCSPGLETSWNGSWRVSGSAGSASWDGETKPSVDIGAAPSHPTATAVNSTPETIAGSLAEFIDSIRTGRVPSGEVHSNVLSLAMVEAAVESSSSGQRVFIESLLETSYHHAVAAEQRPEVLTSLLGWGSARAGLQISNIDTAP